MLTCTNYVMYYSNLLLGIEVSTRNAGVKTVKVMLLQCSVDFPARASLTNMKQFNGKWGCLYCDNPGKTTPNNPLHRFWPHDASSVARTPDSIKSDVVAAVSRGDAVSVYITCCIVFL